MATGHLYISRPSDELRSEQSMEFYFNAASVLDKLDAKQGSIKGMIAKLPEKNRKRTAALVIETLKYRSVLSEIIRISELQKAERKKLTSLNLTLLLVHDLLLAKGIQAGDGPIKQAVLRHRTRLQAELTKLKIKRGATSLKDLARESDERATLIPRYVRVNTLVWSIEEAVEHFCAEGFNLDGDPLNTLNAFRRDPHVACLLQFHSSSTFNDGALVREGKIILQDKASCFPALVLNPPSQRTTRVIDATAAPGNKTTLLNALMKGKGKLLAFEMDKRRFATLRKMLSVAHCSTVEAVNEDFLSSDPSDGRFSSVTHILLDPSCSGSGIVNRLDYLLGSGDDENDMTEQEERLQKLASFQLAMIRHAMKFPAVQKIVYSTCSVHAIENEEVVCKALGSQEAVNGRFKLAPHEDVLPMWPRRGLPEYMPGRESDAECLIRCEPGTDHTNGFFVSCFMRASGLDGHQALQASDSRGDDIRNRPVKEALKEARASRENTLKRGKPTDEDDSDAPLIDCGALPEEAGSAIGGQQRTKKKRKKGKRATLASN